MPRGHKCLREMMEKDSEAWSPIYWWWAWGGGGGGGRGTSGISIKSGMRLRLQSF